MPNVSDKTNPAPAPLLMGEIRVWIASLDLEAEPVERLSRLLSDDEQKRAARFHGRRDAVRFRVHRAALRTILGECLGVEPRVVDFRYGHRVSPSSRSASTGPDCDSTPRTRRVSGSMP